MRFKTAFVVSVDVYKDREYSVPLKKLNFSLLKSALFFDIPSNSVINRYESANIERRFNVTVATTAAVCVCVCVRQRLLKLNLFEMILVAGVTTQAEICTAKLGEKGSFGAMEQVE